MDRSKYEKISDQVMVIANKVVLKMNVALSYYNSNNNRINYHQEVEYYSPKINGNLINIKRHFDYYLSIEHMIDKSFIRIGVSDILKVQYGLNEAYKFFTDSKYEDVYAKANGELIIHIRPNPVIVTGLSMGNYLQFEPSVYEDFRGELQQGLRMYLSSDNSYCDISIRNLEALIYTINNINLFQSAQLMLNYFERPDLGHNLYSCNVEPDVEEVVNFQGKDGRTITSEKNLSYFDKMSQLE